LKKMHGESFRARRKEAASARRAPIKSARRELFFTRLLLVVAEPEVGNVRRRRLLVVQQLDPENVPEAAGAGEGEAEVPPGGAAAAVGERGSAAAAPHPPARVGYQEAGIETQPGRRKERRRAGGCGAPLLAPLRQQLPRPHQSDGPFSAVVGPRRGPGGRRKCAIARGRGRPARRQRSPRIRHHHRFGLEPKPPPLRRSRAGGSNSSGTRKIHPQQHAGSKKRKGGGQARKVLQHPRRWPARGGKRIHPSARREEQPHVSLHLTVQ
jgi:hypothetical protein